MGCFLSQLAAVIATVIVLSAVMLWRLGRGWGSVRRWQAMYYALAIPVALVVMYYPPCEWFG